MGNKMQKAREAFLEMWSDVPVSYTHIACELNGARSRAGKCDGVEGLEFVDKVIGIDQQPIGLYLIHI